MAEREGQKSYAMIPSIVERNIEEGLLSFINREFPISTPGFMTDRKEDKTIVDAFVDDRENLVKGPWLEIRRPFRKSEVETKEVLSLLAGDVYQIGNDFTPYKHQMAAFERLKAPEPKSTIVATGTGSGKTECFLYPILDYILHCNEEHDEKKRKGIKAIIIYPMNALASDQAKRLTKLCFEINRNAKASGLKGMLPTVGLYTGAPGVESRRMSDDGGNYVRIGSTVTVLDKEFDEELVYKIVGSQEADPMNGVISEDSPFGRALLGKNVGDDVVVDAPAGSVEYKLLKVER